MIDTAAYTETQLWELSIIRGYVDTTVYHLYDHLGIDSDLGSGYLDPRIGLLDHLKEYGTTTYIIPTVALTNDSQVALYKRPLLLEATILGLTWCVENSKAPRHYLHPPVTDTTNSAYWSSDKHFARTWGDVLPTRLFDQLISQRDIQIGDRYCDGLNSVRGYEYGTPPNSNPVAIRYSFLPESYEELGLALTALGMV